MKLLKLAVITGLFISLCGAGTGLAAQKALKIGTLDYQKVVENSKEGQAALATIKAKESGFEPQVKEMQNELRTLAKEIEKKSSVWSEEVSFKKKREFEKKKKDYEERLKDMSGEMQLLQKKAMDPILKEMRNAIREIGKREGFSIIIFNSPGNPNNILLYADESLDISDMVVKELDRRLAK